MIYSSIYWRSPQSIHLTLVTSLNSRGFLARALPIFSSTNKYAMILKGISGSNRCSTITKLYARWSNNSYVHSVRRYSQSIFRHTGRSNCMPGSIRESLATTVHNMQPLFNSDQQETYENAYALCRYTRLLLTVLVRIVIIGVQLSAHVVA